MAITSAVLAFLEVDKLMESHGQSFNQRLNHLVFSLLLEIRLRKSRGTAGGSAIIFKAKFVDRLEITKDSCFKSMVHPGDNMEPVMTIMFPNED